MIYQIFVQSFYDSNHDGIGDFNGLITKLDYLDKLGADGMWLMPIHPSPSYHKYDVTDYYGVHPDYGTMDDFKRLVQMAHERKIMVIIDLVINHCSSEHPWFTEAIKNPKSPYRNYFIWATDEEIEALGTATKEIAEDSDNIEQWNEVKGQDEKYYSYFSSKMPDLNYDNPELRKEIYKIGKYWLSSVGVDGFRLDAAKHIYPDDRQEDSHQFWIEFRNEMESVKPDVFLVGEVWDKAEVIAPYFTGLRANFNFDLGSAIIHAIEEEDAKNLVDTCIRINDTYKEVTDDFIDATFLRNHDQNRVASIFKGNLKKAKLAASLLLTLPGKPFIYYGEEIGMKGKKPDHHVREPFYWSDHESGRPTWLKVRYNVPGKVTPLIKQKSDPRSVFAHYKRLLAFRNQYEVLQSGTIAKIKLKNSGVCAFSRSDAHRTLSIYHNLTRKEISFDIGRKKIALFNEVTINENGKLTLPPFASVILE